MVNGTASPCPPTLVAVHSVTIILCGPACSDVTIIIIASPIDAFWSGSSFASRNDKIAEMGGGVPTGNI